MSDYELGYKQGRWRLPPTFYYTKPPEWAEGYARGKQRRRMAMAVEFTILAIVTTTVAVVSVRLLVDAIVARLPV